MNEEKVIKATWFNAEEKLHTTYWPIVVSDLACNVTIEKSTDLLARQQAARDDDDHDYFYDYLTDCLPPSWDIVSDEAEDCDDTPEKDIAPPEYDIGNLVRFRSAFTDSTGLAIDPDAITCSITVPAGTVTAYAYGTDAALVRDSTGLFHLDYLPVAEGIHAYLFAGDHVASVRGVFVVRGPAESGMEDE